MQVSRSGFYAWNAREKPPREKERERLLPMVKNIHRQVRGSYEARRISVELTASGESCGRTKAATLMRLANIEVKRKKK
jgi:putative transposase